MKQTKNRMIFIWQKKKFLLIQRLWLSKTYLNIYFQANSANFCWNIIANRKLDIWNIVRFDLFFLMGWGRGGGKCSGAKFELSLFDYKLRYIYIIHIYYIYFFYIQMTRNIFILLKLHILSSHRLTEIHGVKHIWLLEAVALVWVSKMWIKTNDNGI